MTDTYDDILKRMDDKFTELAGYSPDDASDVGIRMRVLAGEIYSVSCAVDWLRRQTFCQTAEGRELELRAQERGLARVQPVAAAGTLRFGRSTPLWFNAAVPAGTVCSTAGSSPVRYVTTEEAALPQGSLSVDVPARAETGGGAGNAQPGTVTVMVTPPASIESVTNPAAFAGGEDSETDESLRARLLLSCSGPSNGSNAAWYRETALKHGGVHSVQVVPRADGDGTVAVYLGGKGMAPTEETVSEVRDELAAKREIGVTVRVEAAAAVPVSVSGTLLPLGGIPFSDVRTACTAAAEEYFEGLAVGDPVVLSALGAKLFSTGMIGDCSFSTPGSTVGAGRLAVCGFVSFGQMGG